MKKIIFFIFLISLTSKPAKALVLNYGVDIFTNGGFSSVSFFDGDDEGVWVKGETLFHSPQAYELSLDTASFLSSYSGWKISSAILFVDAVYISQSDKPRLEIENSYSGGLKDTPHYSTRVPLVTGGSIPTPYFNDIDNTFFDLKALGLNLDSLFTDSNFNLKFTNERFRFFFPEKFRLDGINLQFSLFQPQQVVPEPGSLFLMGSGLLGLVLGRRRKK